MAYPMIDGLIGSWILLDGQLTGPESVQARICFEPVDDQMFYEVIRIIEKTPLFWEDHFIRLQGSIAGRFEIPSSLYEDSLRLIETNALDQVNLRIVLTASHAVIHQIPSYYPSSDQMKQGIATGILTWERENPNVKVINGNYKSAVMERFAAGGPYGELFELLLADSQGELTEGSRSNLFLIRGQQVYSAPDDRILKGITRKYVTSAIASAGGELVEKMLTYEAIETGLIDAAFLSGSPIDLLPIAAIDSVRLPSANNQLFLKINQAYQKIVRDYLDAHH